MGIFDSIGRRLREVREGMGLTQSEFAAIAAAAGARGATRQSQALYEKGERMPDAAYLGAVAGAGCDVLYVLTGQQLSAARETEGAYMIRAAAEREARGEPPIPGLVEALQGLADTDRRIAERAKSIQSANHYLSALDDEAYQAALEMLRRYGVLPPDDRLVVNRMVAGLAADRR